MSNTPLRLAVIIGSTREGRFGPTVAQWFIDQVQRRTDLIAEVMDLAETPLPPTILEKRTPDVEAFAANIAAADAYVVVTPEYNHSYPAPLKHAIDFVYKEWQAKPVGFVSYGGISGGLRAVEQLRQVFAELHTVTVRDSVPFPNRQFDEAGQPKDKAGAETAATKMLDQLVWWGRALREARLQRPYGV